MKRSKSGMKLLWCGEDGEGSDPGSSFCVPEDFSGTREEGKTRRRRERGRGAAIPFPSRSLLYRSPVFSLSVCLYLSLNGRRDDVIICCTWTVRQRNSSRPWGFSFWSWILLGCFSSCRPSLFSYSLYKFLSLPTRVNILMRQLYQGMT